MEDIVNNVTADLLSGRRMGYIADKRVVKSEAKYSTEDYKEGAKKVVKELFSKVYIILMKGLL